VGPNPLPVTVTAEDETVQVYTVTITRAPAGEDDDDDDDPAYADFTTHPVLTLSPGADPASLVYAWTAADPEAETYTLYYIEGTITDPAQVQAGTPVSWAESGGTLSGLTPGVVYSALVRAQKSSYHAADSAVVQGTTSPLPSLDAPVLTITPGSGALALAWTAPEPQPDSYTLYYKAGTVTDPEAVKTGTSQTLAKTLTTYTIHNLNHGAAYSVLLTAAKTGYNPAETAVIPAAVPPKPAALTVIAGTNSLAYSWAPSEPPVDSYDLYWAAGNLTDPAQVKEGTAITGAASGGTISGLTPATAYSVLVTANIPGFESADSAVSRVTTTAPASLEIKTFNGVSLTFKQVPGGSFQYKSGTANIATITYDYWLGETEVTQELFQAVMGVNPSDFDGSAGKEPADGETQNRRPVEKVNWYAAIAFCNKLSVLDGRDPAYTVDGITNWSALTYSDIPASGNVEAWQNAVLDTSKNGYRLPSYLEWLWAAMGADKTSQPNTADYAKAFAGSDGENAIGNYAWYSTNAESKTHQVAKKLPNELGLYDMSGNVSEWCTATSGLPSSGAMTDYMGATGGSSRSIGSGAFNQGNASMKVNYYSTPVLMMAGSNIQGLRVFCPEL
jgi:formylglycine-generating enzyme required for sulfatase activity